jgi:hypothetical protein
VGKFKPAGERPVADNSPRAAGTFRPEQTRGYATMLGFSVIEMRSSEAANAEEPESPESFDDALIDNVSWHCILEGADRC